MFFPTWTMFGATSSILIISHVCYLCPGWWLLFYCWPLVGYVGIVVNNVVYKFVFGVFPIFRVFKVVSCFCLLYTSRCV